MKRSSPPTFRTCHLADVVLIASKDTLRRNLGVSRPLVLVHYYRGGRMWDGGGDPGAGPDQLPTVSIATGDPGSHCARNCWMVPRVCANRTSRTIPPVDRSTDASV